MSESLLRTDKELSEAYERHVRTVYRVCFAYMKNPADTEDAVEDTFLQFIRKAPAFANEENEKAWLIKTAANICKNTLRHWWRRRESIEAHNELVSTDVIETDGVFQAVMELPAKYKPAVYLYYYEGYTSAEIAGMLKKPSSTVRNYLHEARAVLREKLGDDFDEER